MKPPALLLFALAATRLVAQPASPPDTIVAALGTAVTQSTTIQLSYPIMTLVPVPVRPPVTLLAGSRLQLIAPAPGATHGPIVWYKDDQRLTATGATLDFATVTAADTGNYAAVVVAADGRSQGSDTARVLVTTRAGQRLLNVSTRARIDAGQPFFMSGFVVEPGPSGAGTLVLVRAVGPTLGRFGVADPLAAPQLRLFDTRGQQVAPNTFPFAFPTVDQATQRCGAFALPAGTKDVAQLFHLAAGAYTAHVAGADGASGTTLLEIYEVP